MLICSIDLETTGLDPHHHQILEIGAVVAEIDARGTAVLHEEFQCYIQNDPIIGQAYALQMNHAILKYIAKRPGGDDGVFLPRDAADLLCEFLGQYVSGHTSGEKLVPVGKNVQGFDLPFLRHSLGVRTEDFFSHRCLDPGQFWIDWEADQVPPNTARCKERAGLGGNVAHRALDDAKDCIRLISAAVRRSSS